MTAPLASLNLWTAEPLSADVKQSIEQLRQSEDVHHMAVMPDVHLSKEVCVGIALATRELIYPAAVGSDIGCGMAAVAVDANASLLNDEKNAARLLSALYQFVPSNKHSTPQDLPADLVENSLGDPGLSRLAQRDGRVQLGTLGRGNHFLEFQADEHDQLWVMVHSGSRAMGQAITGHHLRFCERRSKMACLNAGTETGQAYLADISWARTYAAANRLEMLRSVERILSTEFTVDIDWSTLIHSDHDHVQRETHFSGEYWVHRKGAQPAGVGTSGIIPGSMGTSSVHVTGRGCPKSLRSCSHGAGRKLSREAARCRISVRQFERQLQNIWYDHRRSHQLREEAPEAYKDIDDVLRAQRDLIKITCRLRPLLSYKGM
jgi:tRNA-splicing ligase RtcB